MGFSCSPLWCNLYFVAFEIQFMLRLAKLGMFSLMPLFFLSFRFIDDLCVLNNPDILKFLQPDSQRNPASSFWIYPLPIVEIQTELLEIAYLGGDSLATF